MVQGQAGERGDRQERGEGQERFLARTKSFTRRSRELSPALTRGFEGARQQYVIDVPRGPGLTSVDPDFALDPATLFGRRAPLIVEVGPGRGEQLVHFAKAHPEFNFLAFEVWVPGLARATVSAAQEGLSNVRLIEADAQQALKTSLPEASVSEVWTFFPDPWRKSRHRKRRLVAADFAGSVSRILADGGLWRLATDWEDYALQMLQVVEESADLENPLSIEISGEVLAAETISDLAEGSLVPGAGGFAPRFSGRIQTHFEERGLKDHRRSYDITAVRMPRGTDGANERGTGGGIEEASLPDTGESGAQ